MKKLILTIGTALVLLTSCSKEELKPSGPTPIETVNNKKVYYEVKDFKITFNRKTYTQNELRLLQIKSIYLNDNANFSANDTFDIHMMLCSKSNEFITHVKMKKNMNRVSIVWITSPNTLNITQSGSIDHFLQIKEKIGTKYTVQYKDPSTIFEINNAEFVNIK